MWMALVRVCVKEREKGTPNGVYTGKPNRNRNSNNKSRKSLDELNFTAINLCTMSKCIAKCFFLLPLGASQSDSIAHTETSMNQLYDKKSFKSLPFIYLFVVLFLLLFFQPHAGSAAVAAAFSLHLSFINFFIDFFFVALRHYSIAHWITV